MKKKNQSFSKIAFKWQSLSLHQMENILTCLQDHQNGKNFKIRISINLHIYLAMQQVRSNAI